jgi:hypothetical protein
LEAAGEPSVVPDLNHVAGLIDVKCMASRCTGRRPINGYSIQRHRWPIQ